MQFQLSTVLLILLLSFALCSCFLLDDVLAGPGITRVNRDWTAWVHSIGSWSFQANGEMLTQNLTVTERGIDKGIKYSLSFSTAPGFRYRLNLTANNIIAFTNGTTFYKLSFPDGDAVFDWSDISLSMISLSLSQAVTFSGAPNNRTFVWSIATPLISSISRIILDPTITRVQGNARGTTTTLSLTVTMGSNPTAGNMLILVFGSYTIEADDFLPPASYLIISSISETGVTWQSSNTVRKQISWTTHAGSIYTMYTMDSEIWFGTVNSGTSQTIIAALSYSGSGVSYGVADVCEYNGLTSPAADKTASASGTSSNPVTGTTSATSQNDEVWIGGISTVTRAQTTPTLNSFNLLDGALFNGFATGYLEYIASATGTANSGDTCASSIRYAGCIATFMSTSAKTWHSIIWFGILNTRIWSSISWNETLNARAWHQVSWFEILNTRTWQSISWFEQLITPQWHSIVWQIILLVRNNSWDLAAAVVGALIFLPMLIIAIAYIRRKK